MQQVWSRIPTEASPADGVPCPEHHGAESFIGISAVVCTRDRPQQLQRALQSLQEQSAPAAEILVVDNAPQDDAARRLIATHFPGVRYVVEPVPGLNVARNRALRSARQEIVAFLDDDAVADRDWVGALWLAMSGNSRIGACGGRVEALELETEGQRLFEANGGFSCGTERVCLPMDARRARLRGRRAPLIAWAVFVGVGCNLAVRRQLALSLGGFDEALDVGSAVRGGGDNDMVWRVLEAGCEVIYEPAALVRHEHRRDPSAVVDQLIGYQEALVALLIKTAARAKGGRRLTVVAFLGWRLLKPGVRLLRRAAGRDPLPASALLRMWLGCWRGLSAYPAARRLARRRRLACDGSVPT